jgi:hypothetical protein
LSSRLVDFNTTKILSALFELDLCWSSQIEELYYDEEQTDHHNVPFLQLILDPSSFGGMHMGKEYLKTENRIQKLFRDLKDLNNETAGSLVLKASQHKATQRILSNRLSVIWGPPGAYIHFLCRPFKEFLTSSARNWQDVYDFIVTPASSRSAA